MAVERKATICLGLGDREGVCVSVRVGEFIIYKGTIQGYSKGEGKIILKTNFIVCS